MAQRRARSGLEISSVRLAAVVLPPRHLRRVEAQVSPADMVVLADLGAAQAGKEALGLVGASAVQAETLRVVLGAGVAALAWMIGRTRGQATT